MSFRRRRVPGHRCFPSASFRFTPSAGRGGRLGVSPVSLALAAAFAAVGSAHAQTQLSTVEVSASQDVATLALDQVSLTGSRTGIATRDLPASVDTIDSVAMRERGDFQVREAITRSTGLTDTGSGGNGGLSFSSRGFSGTNSVGIAEDGVRLQTGAGTQNYPGSAWGYERVEVLRGPASVVFGSGTVGATVNAVRKAPSRQASLETLLGVDSEGGTRAGVGATGAVGEIGSFRLDAYGTASPGYRDLGDSRGGKLMSTLRLQPSSDVRLDLIADYSMQHPERYWGTPTNNGHIEESLRRENYNADNSNIRYEDKRLRLRGEWRVNDGLTLSNELYTLQATRLWQNIENYRLNPALGTVARSDYLHIEHEMAQTGNRLEAALRHDGHATVLGWETARVNFRHINNSPYSGSSVVSASNPDHGNWASADPTLPRYETATTFNAFYAEDAWTLSERWLLLAGARRDLADISRSDLVGGGTGLTTTLAGNAYRLGLTFRATQATSLYVQASTGSDPVTSLVSMNLANRSYRLTTGRQIEAGIKQSFAEGRGEWTAAVYRIKKDDIITRDPNNAALSIQGGSQHSQGIELTGAISPWKNWRVEGNFTTLQARYDEFSESVGGVAMSRAGNRPTNVPERVANLWAHYRIGAWQASLGGRYVGKRYADNANLSELPAYTVADASLAWTVDKRTTLRLFGRNLTDRVYATSAYNSQFVLGDSRRLELVAEMSF
ncbi:TonB-dependent receptor [Rhodocyclus gracilis]|uniref:TonB-dependent receptor n=1 Tax=Rhodocyclus gracilis TaxID=2929842 RepID=UPI0030F38359